MPGIIDSQADLGPNPWPEYKTYDVPEDSDHDGLPDAWEARHGLNPQSPPGDASDASVGVLHQAAEIDPGAVDWLPVDAGDGTQALATVRAAIHFNRPA